MNWTNIILAIISLLVALIEAFLIPWIRTKWDSTKIEKMTRYVEIGVAAAEQLFDTEQWAEKKSYVQSFLASKGYNVNLTEVDAAIEAAVIRIHNELKTNQKTEEKTA